MAATINSKIDSRLNHLESSLVKQAKYKSDAKTNPITVIFNKIANLYYKRQIERDKKFIKNQIEQISYDNDVKSLKSKLEKINTIKESLIKKGIQCVFFNKRSENLNEIILGKEEAINNLIIRQMTIEYNITPWIVREVIKSESWKNKIIEKFYNLKTDNYDHVELSRYFKGTLNLACEKLEEQLEKTQDAHYNEQLQNSKHKEELSEQAFLGFAADFCKKHKDIDPAVVFLALNQNDNWIQHIQKVLFRSGYASPIKIYNKELFPKLEEFLLKECKSLTNERSEEDLNSLNNVFKEAKIADPIDFNNQFVRAFGKTFDPDALISRSSLISRMGDHCLDLMKRSEPLTEQQVANLSAFFNKYGHLVPEKNKPLIDFIQDIHLVLTEGGFEPIGDKNAAPVSATPVYVGKYKGEDKIVVKPDLTFKKDPETEKWLEKKFKLSMETDIQKIKFELDKLKGQDKNNDEEKKFGEFAAYVEALYFLPPNGSTKEHVAFLADYEDGGFAQVPPTLKVKLSNKERYGIGEQYQSARGGAFKVENIFTFQKFIPSKSNLYKDTFDKQMRKQLTLSQEELEKVAYGSIVSGQEDENLSNYLINNGIISSIDHARTRGTDISFTFGWIDFPQFKQDITPTTKQRIRDLDINKRVALLEKHQILKVNINLEVARIQLMQIFEAEGLNFFDMGVVLASGAKKGSPFELIMEKAKKANGVFDEIQTLAEDVKQWKKEALEKIEEIEAPQKKAIKEARLKIKKIEARSSEGTSQGTGATEKQKLLRGAKQELWSLENQILKQAQAKLQDYCIEGTKKLDPEKYIALSFFHHYLTASYYDFDNREAGSYMRNYITLLNTI